MVFVEDLLGFDEVELVRRGLRPRQVAEPIEVGAHDRRFGSVGVHALQAAELLDGFGADFVGHRRVLDAVAEFVDLVRARVVLAELVLDGAHLFAQELLALVAARVFARLALHLLLHLEDFEFLREDLADLHETLGGIEGLEDFLRFADLETEVRSHEVGETTRIRDLFDDHQDVGREHLAEVDDLLELFLDGLHLLLVFGLALRTHRLFDAGDLDRVERRAALVLGDRRFRDTLRENLNTTVGKLAHPHDHGDGADAEDTFGRRIVFADLFLARQEDETIAPEGFVHRLDRRFAPYEERQDHEGKYDDIPNRKHGQGIGDDDVIGVSGQRHGASSQLLIP